MCVYYIITVTREIFIFVTESPKQIDIRVVAADNKLL